MARLGRILKLMKQLSTALTWRILLRTATSLWSGNSGLVLSSVVGPTRYCSTGCNPRCPPKAPGPGAIRKVEWRALARKHLKDRCVILHTDAAKSYRLRMPGVLHDHVRHCKKRQKIKGKWVWKAPTYCLFTKTLRQAARSKQRAAPRSWTARGGIWRRGSSSTKTALWVHLWCGQRSAVPSTSTGIATRIFGLHLALCVPGAHSLIASNEIWGQKECLCLFCASLEFFPATTLVQQWLTNIQCSHTCPMKTCLLHANPPQHHQ